MNKSSKSQITKSKMCMLEFNLMKIANICFLQVSFYCLFQARNRTGNCGLTYETLSGWYARQTDLPDDAAFFASVNKNTSNGSSDYYSRRQSGFSVGSSSRHPLSRTPTTRSDPSEFKASQVNVTFSKLLIVYWYVSWSNSVYSHIFGYVEYYNIAIYLLTEKELLLKKILILF